MFNLIPINLCLLSNTINQSISEFSLREMKTICISVLLGPVTGASADWLLWVSNTYSNAIGTMYLYDDLQKCNNAVSITRNSVWIVLKQCILLILVYCISLLIWIIHYKFLQVQHHSKHNIVLMDFQHQVFCSPCQFGFDFSSILI